MSDSFRHAVAWFRKLPIHGWTIAILGAWDLCFSSLPSKWTINLRGREWPAANYSLFRWWSLGPFGLRRWHAESPEMTAVEREQQRVSFAYGNVAIDNPNVTREMVEESARKERER